MLCKENIVTWFKDLTSFKRIDVMCNLLQSCQPFETRFIGTCIEELGRKDYLLLRQLENMVNNPAELCTQDLRNINNSDTRIKLSKLLCVLHSSNKRCANELYSIIMNFCEDVTNIIKSGALLNDDNLIDEILLIYALGIFHPAFSFEKKIYLSTVLERLKQEEDRISLLKKQEIPLDNYSDTMSVSQVSEPIQNCVSEEPNQNCMPHTLNYPPMHRAAKSPSNPPPSSMSPPLVRTKVSKLPPSAPPSLIDQNEMTSSTLYSPNQMVQVTDSMQNCALEEPNQNYMPQTPQPLPYSPPITRTPASQSPSTNSTQNMTPSSSPPPPLLERSKHPSVSPMVDQNKMASSPAPILQSSTQHHQTTTIVNDVEGAYRENNMSPVGIKETRLVANGKPAAAVEEANNMQRQSFVMPVICTSSLPCLACLNGATPPPQPISSTSPRLVNKPEPYIDQMRDLRLNIDTSARSSSDSNSDPSPPTTPHDGRAMQSYSRGRGVPQQFRRRPEMNGHEPGPSPNTELHPFYPPHPQQPFIHPHPGPYSIPMIPYFPTGELLYSTPSPYTAVAGGPPANLGHPIFATAAPIQTPQRLSSSSCYNCGSQSHCAAECLDPTMDEVSKQGQYRLDYEGSQFTSVNDE